MHLRLLTGTEMHNAIKGVFVYNLFQLIRYTLTQSRTVKDSGVYLTRPSCQAFLIKGIHTCLFYRFKPLAFVCML